MIRTCRMAIACFGGEGAKVIVNDVGILKEGASLGKGSE